MNLIQFILLAAGLFLSLAWVVRSRTPETVAIKVRDVVLDLERTLRDRNHVEK